MFVFNNMAPKQSVSSHRGIGVLPTPAAPLVQPDTPTVLATEVFDVVDIENDLANVQAAELVSMTEASHTQQDIAAEGPFTAERVPIASTPSQGNESYAYMPDIVDAPMSLPTSIDSRGLVPIPGRSHPEEARRHI